ncbi:MAG: pyrroline-5-carboxylate reductase [Planctomycetota bacterium]
MKIGFIGAGQMATAIATGICATDQREIMAHDPGVEALARFQQVVESKGSKFYSVPNNLQLVNECEYIFIAVKPQHVEKALHKIAIQHGSKSVFISMVAGITCQSLQTLLGTSRVIRTMPNTPCLIGSGAIAVSNLENLDSDSVKFIKSLLVSVGSFEPILESDMNVVTGLSGSGPAYVYRMAEAMIQGGVAAGLDLESSSRLTLQTIYGAAKMMLEAGEEPAVLRERVSSPGGTTIAGLNALKKGSFDSIIVEAIQAASLRASELSSI